MFKKILIIILLVTSYSLLVTKCNAVEQITITTYYPSPYGSYRQLQADQVAIGSGYRNPTYADGSLYVEGNVGIGTRSPTAGYKLDVIGELRCQSLTQYSSRDYKQDIETLAPSDYQDILKKLEQTEIFRFRYKEAKENSRLRLGLIAEEAPEEVVSHEGKGIDLGEAVAFLMAAVKAQAEEIKGLKQEISRLKRN